jgi:hypothetical protein
LTVNEIAYKSVLFNILYSRELELQKFSDEPPFVPSIMKSLPEALSLYAVGLLSDSILDDSNVNASPSKPLIEEAESNDVGNCADLTPDNQLLRGSNFHEGGNL